MSEFSLRNYAFDELKKKKCYAFDESVKALTKEQIDEVMQFIFLNNEKKKHRWSVKELGGNTVLSGRFAFKTYEECFIFVSALYRLGIEQSYYPDITFGDGFVYVSLYTIRLKGLHENDFIMMAHIEEMMGD